MQYVQIAGESNTQATNRTIHLRRNEVNSSEVYHCSISYYSFRFLKAILMSYILLALRMRMFVCVCMYVRLGCCDRVFFFFFPASPLNPGWCDTRERSVVTHSDTVSELLLAHPNTTIFLSNICTSNNENIIIVFTVSTCLFVSFFFSVLFSFVFFCFLFDVALYFTSFSFFVKINMPYWAFGLTVAFASIGGLYVLAVILRTISHLRSKFD